MAGIQFFYTFEPHFNSTTDNVTEHIKFDVLEFHLEEGLNRPFTLDIELISSDANIDFDALIDKPAAFTIWQGDTPVRRIHGLISDITLGKSGHRYTRYRVLVEPSLSRTRIVSDWRIFQQTPANDILSAVLKANRIDNFEVNTQQKHIAREYCIQPGVLDFDFIQRLIAEEGFVYRIDAQDSAHRLLLTDTIQTFGSVQHNRNGTPATQKDGEGNRCRIGTQQPEQPTFSRNAPLSAVFLDSGLYLPA